MSAFLGPIHYWLYNKIQLHEILIEEIMELANKNGYNTDNILRDHQEITSDSHRPKPVKASGFCPQEFEVISKMILNESFKRYGAPVTGPLENVIEHSNIHGWLQEKIISVEKRLAYVVTELIKNNVVKKEEIAGIFNQNAKETMKELGVKDGSPQDFFTLIFDYMLEGMPCDRVNEIIENNSTSITWKTTRCLHKDYWDEAGGDINNFYYFRESWINGFLGASGAGYRYERTGDAVSIIRKV